jgi:hypothetical protein
VPASVGLKPHANPKKTKTCVSFVPQFPYNL